MRLALHYLLITYETELGTRDGSRIMNGVVHPKVQIGVALRPRKGEGVYPIPREVRKL